MALHVSMAQKWGEIKKYFKGGTHVLAFLKLSRNKGLAELPLTIALTLRAIS